MRWDGMGLGWGLAIRDFWLRGLGDWAALPVGVIHACMRGRECHTGDRH